MLRWLISWINGLKIGEVRYIKASPFIIGNMCHFLPAAMWESEEFAQLKYSVIQQRWDGLDWAFVERLDLTREQLEEIDYYDRSN